MTRPALLKRLAAAAFVAAAVAFLGWTILENWRQLQDFDWRLHPLLVTASVTAQVAVLAWGVFVWRVVMARFDGERLSFPALLRIWSLSNAARYIPGNVWQFLAAAQMAKDRGVSRVLLLSSMLVHLGTVLLAAAAIGLLTIPWGALGQGLEWVPRTLPVALPAIALAVHPRLINAALGVVHRVARRDTVRWHGTWAYGLGVLLLQCLAWVVYGGAFWLFLRSVAPFPASTLVPAMGVNAASFLAGWVVFFAPGGLGVREAAMSLLLAPYVPVGVAAAISVLSRLWTIAAEIALALLALAVARRWKS